MSSLPPIKKILCAIDFSPMAEANLRDAVDIAGKCGAHLTILHVVNHRIYEELERVGGRAGRLADVAQEAIDAMEDDRAQRLAKMLVACNAKQVEHASQVTKGVPWERILEIAQEQDVQLIIMGAKGRSSHVRQMRFGSSAEKVFRRAECRVMFLR